MHATCRLAIAVAVAISLELVPGLSAAHEAELPPPAAFEGFLGCEYETRADGTRRPVLVDLEGETDLIRRETRGHIQQATLRDVTDPRLRGTLYVYGNADEYVHPGFDTGRDWAVASIVLRIENAEGAWQGSGHEVSVPDIPVLEWSVAVLTGEGAYDGLTAVVGGTWSDDPCGSELRGLIFAGEPPPMPEGGAPE